VAHCLARQLWRALRVVEQRMWCGHWCCTCCDSCVHLRAHDGKLDRPYLADGDGHMDTPALGTAKSIVACRPSGWLPACGSQIQDRPHLVDADLRPCRGSHKLGTPAPELCRAKNGLRSCHRVDCQDIAASSNDTHYNTRMETSHA
jgi:hypothetical protein